MQWKVLVDDDTVFLHQQDGYHAFLLRRRRMISDPVTAAPSRSAVPTSLDSPCRIVPPAALIMTPIPPANVNMKSAIRSLPESDRLYLKHCHQDPQALNAVATGLPLGECILVVDGSAPFYGGFGWVLAHVPSRKKITGGGCSGNTFWGVTSHRMEASGGFGGLTATSLVCKHFVKDAPPPAEWPPLKVWCDNTEFIDRAKLPAYDIPTHTMHHDEDLHMGIRHLLADLPPLDPQWLKGHQDQPGIDINSLSFPVQMNIEADRLAGEFSARANMHTELPSPHNVATIVIGKTPVSCKLVPFFYANGRELMRS